MRRAHFLQIAFLFLASACLTEAIAKQFEPQEMTAACAFLELPRVLLYDVTLQGLRRLIEYSAVANGAAQLDVFRVRPDQRAR